MRGRRLLLSPSNCSKRLIVARHRYLHPAICVYSRKPATAFASGVQRGHTRARLCICRLAKRTTRLLSQPLLSPCIYHAPRSRIVLHSANCGVAIARRWPQVWPIAYRSTDRLYESCREPSSTPFLLRLLRFHYCSRTCTLPLSLPT